ncbi:Uncharacterised protein [Candidatus Bilamarchaeum dharawalense]|uniref:Uncharacterized protein n=1 Tax=Candidatus Bilamarchaeum dharawalense TaxID=2885759 RepID=A0A5E4LMD9_9ARCH|nr:Uncharacterised protein [Candidatus Bilamarchaeum dharawalense]
MTEIVFFVLAFLAGLLVKVVDWMEDDRKTSIWTKMPLALAYGLLIGYIISAASFGLIFLGALLAQVLARKIDTTSHRFGFLIAIFSLLFLGFPEINIIVLLYFMILAFLDEEDYIGKLRPLTEYRPFLKIGSVLMIILGRWDYFLAIILFDIGYELFNFISKKTKEKKEKENYGGRVRFRTKVPVQRKR